MAKYIGRVLSGTALAFCAVLLMASQTQGQTAKRVMLTISGDVGFPDVVMQLNPAVPGVPPVVTDAGGKYTARVPFGWTGKITPTKDGYTFTPEARNYANTEADRGAESYTANVKTYTITGSVGQAGVRMSGLDGNPVSNENGRYTATVKHGWAGTVIPEKDGWQFDPPNKTFDAVTSSQTADFKASVVTYVISGTIGDVNGVALQGLPKDASGRDPMTGSGGSYSVKVPWNWRGIVKPAKEGYNFTPAERPYAGVTSNQTDQDYAPEIFKFKISGTTRMANVTITGFPSDVISDINGQYTATVPYGWRGEAKPQFKGYSFAPASYNYPKVTSNRDNQDFAPTEITITISGTVSGTGGVVMRGLPNDPCTSSQGFYKATVPYDWSGTVTPTKEGWSFVESAKTYNSLEKDFLKEDYKASPIEFTISGNVGQAGVTIQAAGKTVVSAVDGAYKIDVPYKWNGTIKPQKLGYEFDPPKADYTEVLASQTQDYMSKMIQFTVAGRVVSLEAGAVANASVTAEPGGILTTTDSNGVYTMKVNYGWKGTIRVEKAGYTFAPDSKTLDNVVGDRPNQNFSGNVKMLTITGLITSDGEPIEGVAVMPVPGDLKKVMTDAKGQYTVAVPYGWSGALKAEKKGWVFDSPNEYQNVTQSIDKRPGAAPPQSTVIEPPTTPTQKQPPVADVNTIVVQPGATVKPVDVNQTSDRVQSAADIERAKTIQMLKDMGLIKTDPGSTKDTPLPGQSGSLAARGLGGATGNLISILTDMARQTGVRIFVDATVKPDTAVAPGDMTGQAVSIALEKVLQSVTGKPYKYKVQGDGYLVYKPISNSLNGDPFEQAFTDISAAAGVPIVLDDKVTGRTTVTLTDATLEEAMTMILAGTSYVYKRMPNNYYLVASRLPKDAGFIEVSETYQVNLNYMSPGVALSLISPAFQDYVRAGGQSTDPNNPGLMTSVGHVVTVTAPPKLAERIIADLRKLDFKPRQVLLTARVVSMERGNLLKLGVDWTMPSMSAGMFSDSFVRGTLPATDPVPSGSSPWGVQIGYSSDRTFTNALTAQLNMLHQNGQADIVANPQLMALDGKESQIKNVQEEWFMMTATTASQVFSNSQLEKIESGTILTITPRIADNNDIQLQMAVEVSDSVPAGTTSGLPVVTRRLGRNVVIIPDGGTAAVSGLTENRSKVVDSKVPFFGDLPLLGSLFRSTHNNKESREIAVFVTANIAPDSSPLPESTRVAETSNQLSTTSPQAAPAQPAAPSPQPSAATIQPPRTSSRVSTTPATTPTGGSFDDELKRTMESLSK
jgi:type II secretory pathway component GspD/PulD (secretin)